MNLTRLLFTFLVAPLCIGPSALALPSWSTRQRGSGRGSSLSGQRGSGNSNSNSNSDSDSNSNDNFKRNQNSGKRTRSGRRFRMLQKILKKLTQDDMMQLVRAKKDSGLGYGYGGERFTQQGPGTTSLGHTTIINKVECPVADNDMHTFACPTPDHFGRYDCIDVRALCNDIIECPNGEDEDRTVCMFHKMHMNYFKVFTDALFALTPTAVQNK